MPTFNNVQFKKHPVSKGWAGIYIFEDNTRLSVVCGETMYCDPKSNLPKLEDYHAFEVAVLNDKDEFITKQYYPENNEDVVGWQSREMITQLMANIETNSDKAITTNK
tara:strand:+ start:309 stop:632 length:324 start_codon:yes stop_codon:yes gene_type:complete